jgi:hypothetical protein
MKAKQLLEFLQELSVNNDLNTIDVNYRYDYDSDVTSVDEIHEDLFDESNDKLTSICIIGDTYDYDAEYNK